MSPVGPLTHRTRFPGTSTSLNVPSKDAFGGKQATTLSKPAHSPIGLLAWGGEGKRITS